MFKIYAFLFLSLIFISCSTQDRKQKQISNLEQRVFLDSLKSKTNPIVLNELLDEYTLYAKNYKEDSISKVYLFSAAKLCMAANQHQRAIEFLTSIIQSYPKWEKASEVLFLKGFIYDNTLRDFVNARKAYEQLIKFYPQSEYVDDAQGCIKLLGKSPDEIINSFENADTLKQIQ